MATPTLTTTNFSRIDDCDATTGWSNISGGPGVTTSPDILIQGLASIARRIDNSVKGYGYDMGTTTPLEFNPPLLSGDGANQGEHIFFWINVLQPDLINSAVLRLASTSVTSAPTTADNSIDYEIFPANAYAGGWYRGIVDPSIDETAQNSSPNKQLIIGDTRWLAFEFDMGNVSGTIANCLVDAIDLGRGLIVTGGSTTDKITWADIAAVATSNTNAYGLIDERSGVFFLLGEWQFGAATGDCYFEDTDQIIVWENTVSDNGETTNNIISSVSPDLNALTVVEGTGTTDFINGVKVGTGNDAIGSNGIIYKTAPAIDGNRVNLRLDFSDADITNIELYGCKVQGVVGDGLLDTSITFSSDATNGPNHEVSGCSFVQCGLVDLGRVSAQNLKFSNTEESSKYGIPLNSVQYWDNSASSFIDITSSVQSRDSGRWENPAGGSAVNGDEIYFGLKDQFAGIQYAANALGDTFSNVVWEYWDGTAWSTLTTVTPTALTIFTRQSIDYYPTHGLPKGWSLETDWEQTTVNSIGPYYYIRARLTSNDSDTGGDHGDIFWLHAQTPFNGAALLWNENIDLVNADFSNHTDADTNEKAHGVEHRASGTDAYTTWTFSNNDADILFTAATGNLTIDANLGSNPTTSTVVGSGSVTINTNVTVTLTGLIGTPPTEVRVYDTGTVTELTGQENVTTGSFAINLDATDFVDIRIHNVEYEYISIINFDMPATDTSIPIQQQFDRNYENP